MTPRRPDNNIKNSILKEVERCDVCVVDLDQCIYPRFTQTTLGALLLLRSLKRPYRRFLPRLLSGAAYIIYIRGRQLLGKKPTNYELMRAFCRVIRELPLQLVEECASKLPRMGPQIWKVALTKMSSRMSVFLLTFAIKPIARAYCQAKNFNGEKIFQDCRGTPLILHGERIEGCVFSSHSLSPRAKLKWLEELLRDNDCCRPLIIGHGKDEVLMAARARKMGGSSIGLAVGRGKAEGFDITLSKNAWKVMIGALDGEG